MLWRMQAAATATGELAPARGRRVRGVSGDDRERAILATAERLLGERDLHAISVDDLARGAGISRPAFYFYFASKEAVLLALLDRVVAEARAQRGDVLEHVAEDPPARLREAISAFVETFSTHRAVTVAATAATPTSAAVRELWAGVMESVVAEAGVVIEAERARGAAPPGIPARDLATALSWMTERVLQATFTAHGPAITEGELTDTLLAVWLRAVYGTVEFAQPGDGDRSTDIAKPATARRTAESPRTETTRSTEEEADGGN